MKKIVNNIIRMVGVGAIIISCSTTDLNDDPNSAYETVPYSLFNYATKNMADYYNTPSVNINNFRLIMQYWQETTYVDESNYDFVTRNISNSVWLNKYVDVLQNLNQAKIIINEYQPTPIEISTWPDTRRNQLAIIDLLQAFTYQDLVDTFGDIPYEASNDLANVPLPVYSKGSDIYIDLISRVKSDIADLNMGGDLGDLGKGDNFYRGNVNRWITFGNSLLLKLGITIADSNPSLAQATVTDAFNAGVMSSFADDCLLKYETSSPNYSQLFAQLVASNRNDYVGARTIIDYMNQSSDWRRKSYFDDNYSVNLGTVSAIGSNTITVTMIPSSPTSLDNLNVYVQNANGNTIMVGNVISVTGNTITLNDFIGAGYVVGDGASLGYYAGGIIGNPSPFATFSHVGDFAYTSNEPGIVMNYTEVAFYLAEAAARWGIGGSPVVAYEKAVTASFEQWGLSSAEAASYLLSKPYNASNWKQSVGEQAWVAMFNQGTQSWSFWRRLDYPILVPSVTAVSIADGKVPVRLQYPVREITTNPTNYAAAAAAIGGDRLTTRIFWDVN